MRSVGGQSPPGEPCLVDRVPSGGVQLQARGRRQMTSVRKAAPFILALALLGGASDARADGPNTKPQGVGGRVLGETSSPLGAAGVYAYQLADLSLRKVLTDKEGNFLFQDLPAGLYKVIAHKPGFTPVVVMLTRTAASTY